MGCRRAGQRLACFLGQPLRSFVVEARDVMNPRVGWWVCSFSRQARWLSFSDCGVPQTAKFHFSTDLADCSG